eukprot:SAG31_NODE_1749_length_7358_cov_6.713872_3_plen_145_part_00
MTGIAADYHKFHFALANGGRGHNGYQLVSSRSLAVLMANSLPGGKTVAEIAAPFAALFAKPWMVRILSLVAPCCGPSIDELVSAIAGVRSRRVFDRQPPWRPGADAEWCVRLEWCRWDEDDVVSKYRRELGVLHSARVLHGTGN